MKTLIKQLVRIGAIVASIFLFAACKTTKPQLAEVVQKKLSDDVRIAPELKQFIAKHDKNKKISIVLRTPEYTGSLTRNNANISEQTVNQEDEKKLQQIIYDILERELMSAGFDVRDRTLLESVAKGTDYQEIGKRIQTELIIDIQELTIKHDDFQQQYRIVETGQIFQLGNQGQVNTQYAVLRYKIIIIEENLVGCIATNYVQPCTNGCNFYIYHTYTGGSSSYTQAYSPIAFSADKENWYKKWVKTYNENDTKEKLAIHFANEIIKTLKEE
jgi:hypothetical protein